MLDYGQGSMISNRQQYWRLLCLRQVAFVRRWPLWDRYLRRSYWFRSIAIATTIGWKSRTSRRIYTPPSTFDTVVNDEIVQEGSWIQNQSSDSAIRPLQNVGRRSAPSAMEIRNEFASFIYSIQILEFAIYPKKKAANHRRISNDGDSEKIGGIKGAAVSWLLKRAIGYSTAERRNVGVLGTAIELAAGGRSIVLVGTQLIHRFAAYKVFRTKTSLHTIFSSTPPQLKEAPSSGQYSSLIRRGAYNFFFYVSRIVYDGSRALSQPRVLFVISASEFYQVCDQDFGPGRGREKGAPARFSLAWERLSAIQAIARQEIKQLKLTTTWR
ncbi:hypothetical protein EVAR_21744_1 [Eumeta japonica]|uniref:Uncharacterized protein n=1 Tax=Eumeta variegata TaxID=151549 RepID=A0A4C1ZJ67_EUMVA|nr:hypothetical protein EVAR_21744_1 [Eumeta japonica]